MIKHKPHCFILNAGALGDTIASTPVLKYAIENLFTDGKYQVMMHEHYRCLFPFIPDENIFYFGVGKNLHEPYVVVYMYDQIPSNVPLSAFLNPLRMTLIDYSSVKLLGMLLHDEHRSYPKLDLSSTDISKFKLPEKYVCLLPTILHKNRGLPQNTSYRLAYHFQKRGMTPVFLGKNTTITDTFNKSTYSSRSPTAGQGMIDLIDQTSILEAAKIMEGSQCVFGMDTGLIHLAAMTDVKIVCGYTTVDPSLRMPYRYGKLGWNLTPITPKITQCKFCASSWMVDDVNFNECNNPHEQLECLKEMSADNFIAAFDNKYVYNH